MTKLRLLTRLITVCVIGNMFLLADAQTTSTRHLSVKEIVNAHDPFADQSLRNAVTVKKNEYSYEPDYDNPPFFPKIIYYDRDKNSSTIERVRITQLFNGWDYLCNKRADFSFPVLTINDYKIYIAGDDGKIGRGLGTTHIVLGDKECDRNENRYISKENIVNDLLTFAKSSQNNAFPVKEVEMVIYPWTSYIGYIGFTMKAPDVTRIQQTGLTNTYYGERVFGEGQVKTRNGDYRVTFHSTDGDPGMYETVVIERNDGLRCKVDRLREVELVFITDDGERDSAVIKLIELKDPEIRYITLIDDTMYDSLMTLKDDTVNNHAITFIEKQEHEFIFIDETGIYSSELNWINDGPKYEIFEHKKLW